MANSEWGLTRRLTVGITFEIGSFSISTDVIVFQVMNMNAVVVGEEKCRDPSLMVQLKGWCQTICGREGTRVSVVSSVVE